RRPHDGDPFHGCNPSWLKANPRLPALRDVEETAAGATTAVQRGTMTPGPWSQTSPSAQGAGGSRMSTGGVRRRFSQGRGRVQLRTFARPTTHPDGEAPPERVRCLRTTPELM